MLREGGFGCAPAGLRGFNDDAGDLPVGISRQVHEFTKGHWISPIKRCRVTESTHHGARLKMEAVAFKLQRMGA
jgi:hypothetical protein